jgi:predicted ATP-grasp superfamily ATP-dependent carboligase
MALKRLLITDPFTPQSYDIVWQLRDEYEYCAAVIPSFGKISSFFCFSAWSRLIKKRHRLVSDRMIPMIEIAYGNKHEDKERFYIDEILRICDEDRINLIYPTDDSEVLLLSKYKYLFAERNILLPVNNFQTLVNLFDKQKVIEHAIEAGILCPATNILNQVSIQRIKRNDFDKFKIIKPRFGNSARGVSLISNKREFEQWLSKYRDAAEEYIMQDFVPGNTMIYYRCYFDKNGICVHSSCAESRRPEMLAFQSRGLFLENIDITEALKPVSRILKKLKYIGYAHAQFKVDQRSSNPVFLEINPRISRGTWTEEFSGINGPRISLILHNRSELQPVISNTKDSYVFVWPVQDIIILLDVIMKKIVQKVSTIFFRNKTARYDIIPSVATIWRHYRGLYSQRGKKYNAFIRNFFYDPTVALLYWFSFMYTHTKSFKTR